MRLKIETVCIRGLPPRGKRNNVLNATIVKKLNEGVDKKREKGVFARERYVFLKGNVEGEYTLP